MMSRIVAIQLGFLLSLGSVTSNEAIFQLQAIKTSHISLIYRQTGDKLSVGSTGTAAAW